MTTPNGRQPAEAHVDEAARPPVATITVALFEGGKIGCGLQAASPLSTGQVAEVMGRAIYELIAAMKKQAKPQIAVAPAGWNPPQM